LKSDAHANWWW